MKLFFLLFLNFLVFARHGYCIVGGELAKEDEKSGIIQIVPMFQMVQSSCTATKIAKNALLTAAHCFDEMSVRVLGWNNKLSNENSRYQHLNVVKIEVHPEYKVVYDLLKGDGSEGYTHFGAPDIAIVFVKPTPQFEQLEILKLDFQPVKPNETLDYWGYGCEKNVEEIKLYRKKIGHGVALERSVLFEDQGLMTEDYKTNAGLIYAYNFITSGPKRIESSSGVCMGDSGGPVLRNNQIVGTNTAGSISDLNDASESESGLFYFHIHTRISNIKKWLLTELMSEN